MKLTYLSCKILTNNLHEFIKFKSLLIFLSATMYKITKYPCESLIFQKYRHGILYWVISYIIVYAIKLVKLKKNIIPYYQLTDKLRQYNSHAFKRMY